jgi:hypothetical protein
MWFMIEMQSDDVDGNSTRLIHVQDTAVGGPPRLCAARPLRTSRRDRYLLFTQLVPKGTRFADCMPSGGFAGVNSIVPVNRLGKQTQRASHAGASERHGSTRTCELTLYLLSVASVKSVVFKVRSVDQKLALYRRETLKQIMSWKIPVLPQLLPVHGPTWPFVIDIGGEGRHPEAWNVNPRRCKTCGIDRGEPIPRWIQGRADAVPVGDHVVDFVVVERCPLSRRSLLEISRIAKPGGVVVLRHARAFGRDPHRVAKSVLRGRLIERECRIGHSRCQELIVVLDHVSPTG